MGPALPAVRRRASRPGGDRRRAQTSPQQDRLPARALGLRRHPVPAPRRSRPASGRGRRRLPLPLPGRTRQARGHGNGRREARGRDRPLPRRRGHTRPARGTLQRHARGRRNGAPRGAGGAHEDGAVRRLPRPRRTGRSARRPRADRALRARLPVRRVPHVGAGRTGFSRVGCVSAMHFRFVTAGESHGPGLTALVEGLPAGLELRPEDIDRDLARRQLGHGRGGRMKIENDRAEVTAGIRHGRTLGSPVALRIENRDYANWEERMNPWPVAAQVDEVHLPRPGHADLAGVQKFGHSDVRNVLERASARETAARVASGALAKAFLRGLGVTVHSHVTRIGSVAAPEREELGPEDFEGVDESPVRCLDAAASQAMVAEIDAARKANESLGGVFEVRAVGLVPGIGSYLSWSERLDGRLAQAIMSIQAMKGVSIGDAFEVAGKVGSEAHDEIFWSEEQGYFRETNRAGGLEGGMTTGEQLVVRGAMKPLPTLTQPLRSVDISTKEPAAALRERTDSCTVPAAGVVAEAMLALVLGAAYREKFGGDDINDAVAAEKAYRERIGWIR